MLESLVADLRLAGRTLRRSPVFVLVTVVVVSLGSGAVATIFSAMNALALRPLPGTHEASRLVSLERAVQGDAGRVGATRRYYDALRDRARSLDGVAAWTRAHFTITAGGEGHAVLGNMVTSSFFPVLGVRPALGRFFAPDEDGAPLASPVLVVSHRFWTDRLHADSGAIGRAVTVNGRQYTLVGVAPPGFRGTLTPVVVDAWAPLAMAPHLRPGNDPATTPWLWVFARLRDGTSIEAAHAELSAFNTRWAVEANEPKAWQERGFIRLDPLTGLPTDARRSLLGFAGLLLGAAGLVLLIAGVNVASMLSARALARRREMALRTALGAPRGRLVRQLLTETLALFALGALGGVGLAWLATSALERLRVPGDAAIALELSPDWRVLGVAVLVSLATGLACGLAPALGGAGREIATRLRDGAQGGGARRSLLGNALVVGQLALSLVLLVAAGLFVRALDRGGRIAPGFTVDGVLTASFDPSAWGYDEARTRAWYRSLAERVAAVPGVETVAFAEHLPLTMSQSGGELRAEDGPADAAPVIVSRVSVDVGYFDALRLPLLRGRGFTRSDDAGAPRVAVINETLARRLSPDGSALGRTFRWGDARVTVVGVARDTKYRALDDASAPFVYFPMAQTWHAGQAMVVRVRDGMRAEDAALATAIQQAALAIDPTVPRPTVTTLAEATSIVLLPQRVAAMVTGVLGVTGLVLAAVGLYGIVAWAVSRRTREIGVRVALGARRSDVLRLIVGGGMRLTLVGVTLGLALAAAATRLLSGFLLGVSPLDGLTFAAMSLLFVAITLVASWLPARKAAAADPVVVLRAE